MKTINIFVKIAFQRISILNSTELFEFVKSKNDLLSTLQKQKSSLQFVSIRQKIMIFKEKLHFQTTYDTFPTIKGTRTQSMISINVIIDVAWT